MEQLSSKVKRFRNVYDNWGGSTAAFFAYAHGSHDQCAGLLIALLPFVRDDLGLNYLQAGLLLSAYSVTSGASQFLGGWLGDRVSRYLFIAVGLAGVGLTSLFVGLSSSFSILLGILVIMGIFSGAYGSNGREWSKPTKKRRIKISRVSKGLEPGIHLFQVKAIDSGGLESGIKSITFKK